MSTIGQSLRLSLARTLRRGAFWLDRLALRVTAAKPAGLLADDAPTGDLPGPSSPPAHWLQRAHRPPPAHWLARIRQQAPHLLRGDMLADTGWTHGSVPSPATPAAAKAPAAAEAWSPGRPDHPPRPAFTEPRPSATQRAAPLFAGRVLRLQRAHPPVPDAASPAPATLPDSSPDERFAPWPAAPSPDVLARSPAASSSGPGPAHGSSMQPAGAATVAAGPRAESDSTRYSPASPRARLVNPPPVLPTQPSTAWTSDDHAAPDADTPDQRPSGFRPEPITWNPVVPAAGPDLEAAAASQALPAPKPPHERPAHPRPAQRLAASDSTPGTSAPSPRRVEWASEAPSSRWAAVISTERVPAPDTAPRAALPWPALPDWPVAGEAEPNPDDQTRVHRQRLDQEQRGLLWNESPF